MDERIISVLSRITDEEREILEGDGSIDRDLYMRSAQDVINGEKLLAPGKLITVRPHTRFVRFPEHTHDYVEMVYMVSGETTHIINGNRLCLQKGELLILGQSAIQEILPAGEGDIAVNFIVRPEFFSGTLPYLGDEETPLRDFIVRVLCGDRGISHLYFRVADILPVQNLMENLLWTLINDIPNKRGINQMTMGLLFAQILNFTDRISFPSKEQNTLMYVLRYVEERYRDGSLQEIAQELHYEFTWLSRLIKKWTGKTYTQLMQEKRLSQAGWLLKNTDRNVEEIALAVGYENVSYFHRIFAERYGVSPKKYRDAVDKVI